MVASSPHCFNTTDPDTVSTACPYCLVMLGNVIATNTSAAPLVVVWDNLNAHVSRVMAELAAARDWLAVFQLPPYASELNPVEAVWSHLKRSLANLVKRDISQLTALVKTRLRSMQYRPGLIEGFLAGTRLDLTPFCNCRDQR